MSNQRSASKSSIEKLVHFFEKNCYQLKSPNFNETQARQQLIDLLFEALGWDVHNRKMNPVYLQEVIIEGGFHEAICAFWRRYDSGRKPSSGQSCLISVAKMSMLC